MDDEQQLKRLQAIFTVILMAAGSIVLLLFGVAIFINIVTGD